MQTALRFTFGEILRLEKSLGEGTHSNDQSSISGTPWERHIRFSC